MFLEVLREIEQLFRVARKPCELGKNQALNMPAFCITKHPLTLGMFPHGFPADTREVIDFDHRPAIKFRIAPRAIFVMGRAFALRLIFGGNANPNSNPFPVVWSNIHKILKLQCWSFILVRGLIQE